MRAYRRAVAEREVPGWLRAVQVFEGLGLVVGLLLVVLGVSPRLGVGVAVGSLLVALLRTAWLARS
jgi:uncharacterized protein YacL